MQEKIIEGYRLSLQQKNLWLLSGGGTSYRAQCALILDGRLDPETFRLALEDTISRHEILRTSFQQLPGMDVPLQVIRPEPMLCYREINLSAWDTAAQEIEVGELFKEDGLLPFDFEHGPLVRFSMVVLSAQRHILLVSLSSQCADAWTLIKLAGEIGKSYLARLKQRIEINSPVQYVDFAEWQEQLLQADDGEGGREFWRKHISLAIPVPVLPFESRLPPRPGFAPVVFPVLTGLEVTEGIDAVVRKYDATREAFLLSCWQILLWRLTDQTDVLVECLCDGRNLGPLRDALGPYASYLPVYSHLADDYRFDEVLQKTVEALGAAVEHERYYLAEKNSEQEKNLPGTGSFPIAFDYLEWPGELRAAEIGCRLSRLYVCTDRFKLKLSAIRNGDALNLEIHSDPEVYPRDLIERLSDQLQTLLRHVVRAPEVRVSEANILSEAERHTLLVKWNDTKSEFAGHSTVHELFEVQVERSPDAIAVVSGEDQLSYEELNGRANRLARYLRRAGVGCESRVGLLLGRSTRMIEALLGVLKAGGAYVPLDPGQAKQRLELMLEDAGVALLLTEQRLAVELPLPHLRVTCLDSDSEVIAGESEANLGEPLSPRNLAYIIYTSGSTGRPNGVMIEHRSVANLSHALVSAVYSGLGANLRVSLNAPLTFDSSVKQLVQLLYGHALYVVPDEVRYDGQALVSFLTSHNIDVLDCTPSQLRLMREGREEAAERAARALLIGGETLDETVWDELRASGTPHVFNVYGPTECTVDATVGEVRTGSQTLPNIGKPIANIQTYLLDAHARQVPLGATGELHIAGAGLGRGYINRSDGTAGKFIPNPFSTEPGQRLYKTGDLARHRKDGTIEFLGRLDHQVKVRGYRVELAEIEAALKSQPEVSEAVVVARPDEFGGKQLAAYMVLYRHSELAVEELRRRTRERLPEYMVPSVFAFLKELPLTPNGKIDRRALPEIGRLPADAEQDRTTPLNVVGGVLTQILAEVLHIEQVGMSDNFFDLGGHSLLAAQVISRVNEAFKIELPLRSLFDNPRVADLAGRVQEALSFGQGFEAVPIARVPRDGHLPVSYAQQRLWFTEQLEPGSPAYFSVRPLPMRGYLSESALEQALSEVMRRHEVLRTCFSVVDGQPVQVISPASRLAVPVVDLTGLSKVKRQEVGQRLVYGEWEHSFDLSRLPLMRVSLLRFSHEERVVLVSMHHIIIDGWSISIMTKEVNALYEAFSFGKQSPLSELAIQYADFAAWQQRQLQAGLLESQLAYWKQQLSHTSLLQLPSKQAEAEGQAYRGAMHPLFLSSERSQELYAFSRREGVTLHMTMTAALDALLYLYTGQEDIMIGVGTAGRDRVEVERLIGFFINMLALRVDLSDNPTFRGLLKRVREVALTAYAHQDVPFEKVISEIRSEWEPGRKSLFQVVFSLQNYPTSALDLTDLSFGTDLSLNAWRADIGSAHFDFMLFMFETPLGLRGGIEYNTDLFDSSLVSEMGNCFDLLLEKIVADPEARLFDITLLEEEPEPTVESIQNAEAEEGEQFNFSL